MGRQAIARSTFEPSTGGSSSSRSSHREFLDRRGCCDRPLPRFHSVSARDFSGGAIGLPTARRELLFAPISLTARVPDDSSANASVVRRSSRAVRTSDVVGDDRRVRRTDYSEGISEIPTESLADLPSMAYRYSFIDTHDFRRAAPEDSMDIRDRRSTRKSHRAKHECSDGCLSSSGELTLSSGPESGSSLRFRRETPRSC